MPECSGHRVRRLGHQPSRRPALRAHLGLQAGELGDRTPQGVLAGADVVVEDGGELVAEVLGDHLPGFAELLVEPLGGGMVAEVAVDDRLGPGVVRVVARRRRRSPGVRSVRRGAGRRSQRCGSSCRTVGGGSSAGPCRLVRTTHQHPRPSPSPVGSPGAAVGRRTAPSLRGARSPGRSRGRRADRSTGRASPAATQACASRPSCRAGPPARGRRVLLPFSITFRLCSTRHFVTGTSPMVGRMWAFSRDSRPSSCGCLPRSMLSLRYSSPSIRIVRAARTSARGGLPLGVQGRLGLGEDLASLVLGVGTPQDPLPRLAVAGRRPEHHLVLRPAGLRCVEAHPPRPRAAALVRGFPCASSVGFLRGGIRVPPRLDEWASLQAPENLLRVSLSCITGEKMMHVPLVRSQRNGQPARQCDQPLSAPTRRESGGLVGVGTRRVCRGEAP